MSNKNDSKQTLFPYSRATQCNRFSGFIFVSHGMNISIENRKATFVDVHLNIGDKELLDNQSN